MRIRDIIGDFIGIVCLIGIWVVLLFFGYALVG
jgi:hypothetical protein